MLPLKNDDSDSDHNVHDGNILTYGNGNGRRLVNKAQEVMINKAHQKQETCHRDCRVCR